MDEILAAYKLLTGATGMLGRYLLRDMLVRGWNLAVLVRPGRRESARDKIEAVLSYWEKTWNCCLPRPIVLTGNIVEDGLGLDSAAQRWVASNCDAIIHSAASLTFYEEDGEPWLSNVQGVQNVLNFCQESSIRRLYYISTAYTCGLRIGTVYEDELDVGQEFGNDYERSKVQAEELIRQSTWLDVASVFRPSIIVGDSLSGYTSTFHGFYTPLRLICALRSQLSHAQLFATDFMSSMGLTGSEGKNFVPVDWVSAAITSVMERRPDFSQTYTLASTTPVSTARMMDTLREVSQSLPARLADGVDVTSAPKDVLPSEMILQAYQQQFQTYRSYWRNDPIFDCAHTHTVLTDLPCPVVTDDMLGRLAKWAIDARFSVPRLPRAQPTQWSFDVGSVETPPEFEVARACVLQVIGQDGGTWTLELSPARPMRIAAGRLAAAPELSISSAALMRIVSGTHSLDSALKSGEAVQSGPEMDPATWRDALRQIHRLAGANRLQGNAL